jgi:hypothetical protein
MTDSRETDNVSSGNLPPLRSEARRGVRLSQVKAGLTCILENRQGQTYILAPMTL